MAADPYTRCPGCGFIVPPESMDYALPPGRDGIDWSRPVRVTCPCCHASYPISAADVRPADARMSCRRCPTAVPHPAGAARVRCPGCGLFLLGPDLTASELDELSITEGLTGLADRAAAQAARTRGAAGRDRTETGQ